MKTHTLRWNGARTGKILTFTPKFERMLCEAHPWAARFLIYALLKHLSGEFRSCTLDYEQEQRLEKAIPVPPQTSAELSCALRWLERGHRILDADLEWQLQALDAAGRALFASGATLDEDHKGD